MPDNADNPVAAGSASADPLASVAMTVDELRAAAKLDEVDLNLLALLAADSRISQRQAARTMHMSAPAIGDRIARLERLGVIRGYTVDIDWSVLGYPVQVYLSVTARNGSQAVILRALNEIYEVQEISLVSGSIDMLARLRVRDHAHLRQVILDKVFQIPGVQRTETMICIAEVPAKNVAVELIEALAKSKQDADTA
jgi:Lrp/AsnC family transcriptional regulator, leucine-responsive regulatory protein